MKKLLLSLITFLLLSNAFGQKFEFNACLNSGLFSFVGRLAVKDTYFKTVIGYHGTTISQMGNTIGSRSGLSYGGSFNLKRVAKKITSTGWILDMKYFVVEHPLIKLKNIQL